MGMHGTYPEHGYEELLLNVSMLGWGWFNVGVCCATLS